MKNFFGSSRIRFFVFVGTLLVFIIAGKLFNIDAQKIDDFLENISFWQSAGAFVLLYVAGTFLVWHLKDPLKIVGALLFGAYVSTGLIYLAEIVNAYIFFTISGKLGKEFVQSKVRGRSQRFYEKVGALPFGWIFLLRVIPLIPYRVLDLVFGLSKVKFKKYLIVVLLGSLPRIFFHQFPLALLREFSFQDIAGAFKENPLKLAVLITERMQVYFLAHPVIYLWFLLYVIFAIIVIFKAKKRLQ